tara:strand:- start:448 stop:702 length:255 start_codon:yes stop_codon:yes gene_type:complete
MTQKDINLLKKQVIYRCSYTGTKETDLIFKKFFLKKMNYFSKTELIEIIEIFTNYSDVEILSYLLGESKAPIKIKNIIKKLQND